MNSKDEQNQGLSNGNLQRPVQISPNVANAESKKDNTDEKSKNIETEEDFKEPEELSGFSWVLSLLCANSPKSTAEDNAERPRSVGDMPEQETKELSKKSSNKKMADIFNKKTSAKSLDGEVVLATRAEDKFTPKPRSSTSSDVKKFDLVDLNFTEEKDVQPQPQNASKTRCKCLIS